MTVKELRQKLVTIQDQDSEVLIGLTSILTHKSIPQYKTSEFPLALVEELPSWANDGTDAFVVISAMDDVARAVAETESMRHQKEKDNDER